MYGVSHLIGAHRRHLAATCWLAFVLAWAPQESQAQFTLYCGPDWQNARTWVHCATPEAVTAALKRIHPREGEAFYLEVGTGYSPGGGGGPEDAADLVDADTAATWQALGLSPGRLFLQGMARPYEMRGAGRRLRERMALPPAPQEPTMELFGRLYGHHLPVMTILSYIDFAERGAPPPFHPYGDLGGLIEAVLQPRVNEFTMNLRYASSSDYLPPPPIPVFALTLEDQEWIERHMAYGMPAEEAVRLIYEGVRHRLPGPGPAGRMVPRAPSIAAGVLSGRRGLREEPRAPGLAGAMLRPLSIPRPPLVAGAVSGAGAGVVRFPSLPYFASSSSSSSSWPSSSSSSSSSSPSSSPPAPEPGRASRRHLSPGNGEDILGAKRLRRH